VRRKEHSAGSVFSSTLGAALEWYDFTLYVYPAPIRTER
jgi:hypothetical protein